MRLPIIGNTLDERFIEHRRRSTGIAGIAGGIAAVGLFEWRLLVDGVWSWDLLFVASVLAAVKIVVLLFLRLTD